MDFIKLIGLFAGLLTTISFIPQVIKVIKTKSTRDISLWMFLLFSAGVFCWLIYGILDNDIPVIAANFVTFILSVIILVYKLKHS